MDKIMVWPGMVVEPENQTKEFVELFKNRFGFDVEYVEQIQSKELTDKDDPSKKGSRPDTIFKIKDFDEEDPGNMIGMMMMCMTLECLPLNKIPQEDAADVWPDEVIAKYFPAA